MWGDRVGWTPLLFVIAFSLSRAGTSGATPFTPGNLLVTHNNILSEYTRTGAIVQNIPVPHPTISSYKATDVVVDADGRAHVLNSAFHSYLSTYNPFSEIWEHHDIDFFLGIASDGDLSILGDRVFTKTEAISLIDFSREPIHAGLNVGEVSVGLDGLLYVLDSTVPRPGVAVRDPVTYVLRGGMTLHDEHGSSQDARGIAVTPTGEPFVASLRGTIYHYSAFGTLRSWLASGEYGLGDIELAPDGTIAVGGNGEVILTDTSLQGWTSFDVPYGTTYLAFVPGRIPEPSPWQLLSMGIGLMVATKTFRRSH